MKKFSLIFASALIGGQLLAGGIVSNTNQSAQYVRMMSRNASLQIDAAYFNPAGIAGLDNGFHLALNNQTIFQTKTVTTTFPTLNNKEFVGDVKAPLFPSFFAAYKKDKIGVSFAFGPNGGGGSAVYDKGLPSFEQPVSMIPSMLSAQSIPTNQYSADVYFDGSSVYWGSQLNVTYEINDQFSIAGGLRMVNAKNVYKGHIRDIMINPNLSAHPLGAYLPMYAGTMVSAPDFFNNMSLALTGASAQALGAAQNLQPLVDGGVPDLETALALNLIDQATYDQLTGGLQGNYVTGMPMATVQGAYNLAGAQYAAAASDAANNATATSDIEVDATQTGLAFTPILSVQYSPNDKLNIAIKYEMNTALTLTNDTKVDGSGMFTNDSSFRADIPAILAVGVGYKFTDKFRTQFSFNSYFDKQADWGGRQDQVDKNMWEAALGFEYDLSDKLTGSIGYSRNTTGVGGNYQTDISYSNSSNTIGLGVQIRPMENLAIDLGGLYVMYQDFGVDTPADAALGMPAYNTNFAKTTSMVAIGVSYKF